VKIAVLCVQGAFAEHEKVLQSLGAEIIELRKKEDVLKDFDGLVLPGGESTVQGKLLRDLDMFDTLKEKIENGLPVLATCAGLILLAAHISNDSRSHFGTIPITVKRNAYGRQLESFYTEERFGEYEKVPMEFIRAPYIQQVEPGVEVLAVVDGNIVGVKYKNQIGVSFHPELCSDTRIHEMFLAQIPV
jgi:5'-phosphate synthase pdxT subunit